MREPVSCQGARETRPKTLPFLGGWLVSDYTRLTAEHPHLPADGSIWKGDLSTGKGEVVLSDAGGQAVGLTYDRRSDYLYVAGGDTGDLRVLWWAFNRYIREALKYPGKCWRDGPGVVSRLLAIAANELLEILLALCGKG